MLETFELSNLSRRHGWLARGTYPTDNNCFDLDCPCFDGRTTKLGQGTEDTLCVLALPQPRPRSSVARLGGLGLRHVWWGAMGVVCRSACFRCLCPASLFHCLSYFCPSLCCCQRLCQSLFHCVRQSPCVLRRFCRSVSQSVSRCLFCRCPCRSLCHRPCPSPSCFGLSHCLSVCLSHCLCLCQCLSFCHWLSPVCQCVCHCSSYFSPSYCRFPCQCSCQCASHCLCPACFHCRLSRLCPSRCPSVSLFGWPCPFLYVCQSPCQSSC